MSEKRPPIDFGTMPCDSLAQALIGMTLRLGGKEVCIRVTKAYPRDDNQKPFWKKILEKSPGHLLAIACQGSCIPVITCVDDDGKSGACVQVRQAENKKGQLLTRQRDIARKLRLKPGDDLLISVNEEDERVLNLSRQKRLNGEEKSDQDPNARFAELCGF